MTKREEIREVIDIHADDGCLYPDKDCEFRREYGYCISYEDAYKCLMKRLDEIGVVIKVDRELPKEKGAYDSEAFWGDIRRDAFSDMLKAGYVAVEPLIKDF